ncbi:MAG: NHL repeat-containing protein [Planctomycetaceae bacterium]|nr:NHL repeat-containing protein [Planctomycetaceae bacterium]
MKQYPVFIAVVFALAAFATGQSIVSAQDANDKPLVSEFQYPLAVAAAPDGTVFVADRTMPGIWKLTEGKKSVFFQASKRFRTPLNAVRCLAFDHEGKLLAGDSSTREVYRFDDQGQPQPLTNGWIGIPMAIAVAPDGTIYTADLELHRIWKMPAEGSKEPEEFAVINSPRGLTLDPEGNLWVLSTSSKNGQIQKVKPDGTIEFFIKGHPFNLPHNIVRTDDGSFFVTDNYEHCVWKITADGQKQQWIAGAPMDRPVGLCRSGENLLIADPHIRTIFSLAPDKTLSVLASSPVDPPANLKPTLAKEKPADDK